MNKVEFKNGFIDRLLKAEEKRQYCILIRKFKHIYVSFCTSNKIDAFSECKK